MWTLSASSNYEIILDLQRPLIGVFAGVEVIEDLDGFPRNPKRVLITTRMRKNIGQMVVADTAEDIVVTPESNPVQGLSSMQLEDLLLPL